MRAKIDLDLNDVALLVRVVRRRSFSAAARERGVPVSTVSRRIARLESALGLRLLERTTRTLRLTDAGRAYFEHAERAMDDLAQGTGQVRELQDEPRGRVRIAAPIAFGPAVADAVYRYLAKHVAEREEPRKFEQPDRGVGRRPGYSRNRAVYGFGLRFALRSLASLWDSRSL